MMTTLSSNFTVAAEPHLSLLFAAPAVDSSSQVNTSQSFSASTREDLGLAGALLSSLRLSQAQFERL
jgi:hypothetical protein